MNTVAERTASVKSAARSLDLLELFAQTRDDLTLNDVCKVTGWPKSSTLGLLRTLRDRDYLAVGGRDHSYRLGPRVATLGAAFLQRVDLVREGLAVVRDVSHRCDETVHLAALRGNEVQYLAKEEGTSRMRMVSTVGAVLPAHGTGVGKMLLSALEREQLDELFPVGQALERLTELTIVDRDALMRELWEIDQRGYARDRGESTVGLECIAAPVLNAQRQVVAAMSVSVPQPRFTPEREPFLRDTLLAGARTLSHRLGYMPLVPTDDAVPPEHRLPIT